MLTKLDLDSGRWGDMNGDQIPNLIRSFLSNTDSKTFGELADVIWDSGVCNPCFFATIPYMIEEIADQSFEIAKDFWSFIGSWISTQEFYRKNVPKDILEWFDRSVKYAEKMCIEMIAQVHSMEFSDASYLYASLFVFANHPFGYMIMSGYKDDTEGVSIAKCNNGHLNDVTVYNSGIVAYEEKEQPRRIAKVPSECFQHNFIRRESNPWECLAIKFQEVLSEETCCSDIRSHLELASLIVSVGVTSDLPMKFAFSLYGSFLFSNGDVDEAMRIFHGWDKVKCQFCEDEYLFAEHWCEKDVR